MSDPRHLLVVGATGSIGRLVVAEALRGGHRVRAAVRSSDRARLLPAGAESVVADLARPDTLRAAVHEVDAIVFTHGSQGGKAEMAAVDYGGVRNVLCVVDDRTVRVVLMTMIGVTNRGASYNRSTEGPDWKRRWVSARPDERTPVHDRPAGVGSTTTARPTTDQCSSKVTAGAPAAPATAPSPASARSTRSRATPAFRSPRMAPSSDKGLRKTQCGSHDF